MNPAATPTPSSTQGPLSRRNLLRLAALGTAGVPLLTSCGGDAPSPGNSSAAAPVTLSLWTHDKGYISYFTDYARKLGGGSAGFATSLQVTQAPPADLVTKALAAYTARASTPDLLGIEISQFSRFLKDGIAEQVLLDLTPALGASKDQFFDQRWSPYTIDGKVYGVESSYPLAVYYYRQDLLQKFKISPESLQTWDDVLKAGEITARDGVALGVIATGGDPGAVLTHFGLLFQQRGGQFFAPDGSLTLDSREAVEALTLMVAGLKSGAFTGLSDFFGGPGTAVLKQGRTAGYFMPDWFNVFVLAPSVPEQKGKWRIAPLPRFTGGGSRTSVWGGTGFAVSKDKPGSKAAYELLAKSYLTVEGQLQRFTQLKYLPTMKAVWEDPQFLAYSDEFLGGQEIAKVYKELATEAPGQNQSLQWNVMQTELSKQLVEAYNGRVSPSGAITAAAKAIASQAT